MQQSIEQIISDLSQENNETSVQSVMDIFNFNFPYPSCAVVYQLVYSAFVAQAKDFNFYFIYFKSLETILEANQMKYKVLDVFMKLLLGKVLNKSDYLLVKIIENKFPNRKVLEIN